MPVPKEIPPCPPPPSARGQQGVTREYSIRLLTPLFGGGVETKIQDPVTLIRGPGVRGQLQFWWRATRGAVRSTLEQMRQRHAEVWGATDRVSPVTIEVADLQSSPPQPSARFDWNPQAGLGRGGWRLNWQPPCNLGELPYFLFPFQGEMPPSRPDAQPRVPPAPCVASASFVLRLRFPAELQADVEEAVWAWVNFGGLGSRTRRGCGSLFCRELAPADLGQLRNWFAPHRVQIAGTREWPVFPGSMYTRPKAG